MERLAQHLTCPICRDVFSTTPYTLGCLHSFCLTCITEDFHTSGWESQEYPDDDETFDFPDGEGEQQEGEINAELDASSGDFYEEEKIRPDRFRPFCPVCRTVITFGKVNPHLGSILDEYLSCIEPKRAPNPWDKQVERTLAKRMSALFGALEAKMISDYNIGLSKLGLTVHFRQVKKEEYIRARNSGFEGVAGMILIDPTLKSLSYEHDEFQCERTKSTYGARPGSNVREPGGEKENGQSQPSDTYENPKPNPNPSGQQTLMPVRTQLQASYFEPSVPEGEKDYMEQTLDKADGIWQRITDISTARHKRYPYLRLMPEREAESADERCLNRFERDVERDIQYTLDGLPDGVKDKHANYFLMDEMDVLQTYWGGYMGSMHPVESWGSWFERVDLQKMGRWDWPVLVDSPCEPDWES